MELFGVYYTSLDIGGVGAEVYTLTLIIILIMSG